MTENGPDGGTLNRPGETPPDLLVERFGDPENERHWEPESVPWPSDQRGPTWWWEREQIRKTAANNLRTLAEEVAGDGPIHGNNSGHDDARPGDRG